MPVLPILLLLAGRDLFLPIAGRISDPLHDVRTRVTLTNGTQTDAHATVSFISTASTLRPLDLTIPAHASRSVDPFGNENGLGALRITSDQSLTGSAEISTPASSAKFDALPSSIAIGSGDAADFRRFAFTHAATETNRLYVVETAGDVLQYSVIIIGRDGHVLAQNLHLIHPFEQHTFDLDGDFQSVAARDASVRLRGINGGGRVVAVAAVTKKPGGTIVAHEMENASRSARGLSATEKLAYAAIALFIIGAALWRRP